jgi:hypothetical protein
MFHLFRTYVAANAFMLQVFHEQVRQGGTCKGGPLGRSDPRVHAGSKAGAVADAKHQAVSIGVAAGAEHEATSMDEQQAWSTKLHPWTGYRRGARSCIYRHSEGIIIENGRTADMDVQTDATSGHPGLSLSVCFVHNDILLS